MMKYFREDLHRRLLSVDFKKQVDGLEMLHKVFFLTFIIICILLKVECSRTYTNCYCTFQALPSIAKEVIEVLDILLRWFVLQFCKSNTTCLLKV